ncbi:ABC transporter ATP-binding protein [Metasolibacillus sp. FSL K6-0083]|uniref:ABC transporter ATP-binding protein n=1 Tax=Metasolibacillus sp. FSL K6-0083 TaxID=2921416 RepID=UPI0007913EC8|nr:iron-enterobactin transporter ATP-binding protein [[Bacillus] sp. KCTC 13219]
MTLIQAKDVTIHYESTEVVKAVNIAIEQQKVTTIIGPNGCGKSTLLKALTRIIPHKKGQILLDGEQIAKFKTKDLAKRMAILPQVTESPAGLTVGELVSYGRFPHQSRLSTLNKEDYEIIDWALSVTNTLDYKYKAVDNLSGGQRQRVWIAMALAQKTDIIFLDEPTTYLDMGHQLEVLTLLKKLNEEQNCTIVMVLHDLNHAARFSHNLIAMRSGEIIKVGDAEEVMTKEILAQLFDVDVHLVRDPKTNKPICLTYDLFE